MRPNDRWGYLLVLGTALTLFGYQALRGDEASRLFHMFAQIYPELFRRDWYVQGYQDVNPHAPYFFVIGILTQMFGIFPSLLLSYLFWILVLFCGTVLLYRTLRPEDPDWRAWLAALTVLLCQAGNLGLNAIFESEFKPRMLANAFALVGLAFLLRRPLSRRHALLAGLCVALTILAHVGVGVLVGGVFGLMMIWWMVKPRESQVCPDIGVAFLVANASALLLRVPYLLGVDDRLAGNAAEISLMQKHYILSHAGHFYPPAWPWSLWVGAIALTAYALTLPKIEDRALSFRLKTAGITVGLILLGGLLVSSSLLVYKLVLLQPFRLTTLVRTLLAVFIAVKLGDLSQNRRDLPRLLLLLSSLTDDLALILAVVTEVVGARWPRIHPSLVFSAAVLATVWLSPKAGMLFWVSLVGVVSFQALARHRHLSVKLLALVAIVIPTSAFLVQLVSPQSALARKTSVRWQFLGTPSLGLEPMADWCRRHTKPDTLFLTPPDIPGFRVWARRALVLDATTPPISGPEIAEYLQRVQELSIPGGTNNADHSLAQRYRDMDSDRLLELCHKYGADCVITIGPRRDPRLQQLHRDDNFYLYRVQPSRTTQT